MQTGDLPIRQSPVFFIYALRGGNYSLPPFRMHLPIVLFRKSTYLYGTIGSPAAVEPRVSNTTAFSVTEIFAFAQIPRLSIEASKPSAVRVYCHFLAESAQATESSSSFLFAEG